MIDARGLSCPQPVLMLANAIKTGDINYEIIVDNNVAKENVSRFALNAGYKIEVTEDNGDFIIKLKK